MSVDAVLAAGIHGTVLHTRAPSAGPSFLGSVIDHGLPSVRLS